MRVSQWYHLEYVLHLEHLDQEELELDDQTRRY
jgi:hypothetical protein